MILQSKVISQVDQEIPVPEAGEQCFPAPKAEFNSPKKWEQEYLHYRYS